MMILDTTPQTNNCGDLQIAAKFIEDLFLPTDHALFRPIETWVEDSKKKSRVDYKGTYWPTLANGWKSTLWHILQRTEENLTHVFFGVCPRFGSRQYDKAWQIRTIRVLWADIDDLTSDTVAGRVTEVIDRCNTAGLPRPSVIVSSGNGVHLYWQLSDPYLIDDVGDPPAVQSEWVKIDDRNKNIEFFVNEFGDRVYLKDRKTGRIIHTAIPTLSPKAQYAQDMLQGIAASIGGDATHDLSRILRVPGTLNRKDQRNGRPPTKCELVENNETKYSIDQFSKFAEQSPDRKKRDLAKKMPLPTRRKLTPSRADKLAQKVAECETATDRSKADFALCCDQIKAGIDAEDVWEQVKDKSKFAERGRDYFDQTWSRAENVVRLEMLEKAVPPSDGDTDGRIEILLSTNESHVTELALKALSQDQSLFQRAGRLVQVACGPSRDGIQRPEDAPRVMLVSLAGLRERLTRFIRFVGMNAKGEMKREHPPKWCYDAIDARGQWSSIRPLAGVVTSPVLRPDGSVLTTPGYDMQTGLLFEPGGVSFPIVERPTRDDAIRAVDSLLEVVRDFPFAKAEHRAAWIAYLLTLLARFAFYGPAPLFLVDANVRGSGKGLLCDVVGLIVNGRDMPRMVNPKDDDECRKRITSLALSGDTMCLIDNIDGPLGCDALDAAITATTWKDRILGKSEMTAELPLNVTWAGTGNNVILKGDTPRRVTHIRLDSPLENPEEREGFQHANLKTYVRENHPKLLADALTILSAFCHAGRPQTKLPTWGSFEGWSDLVRQAIVWCGQPDPGATRTELVEQSDREAEALRELLDGWDALDPDRTGLTAGEILARLFFHQSMFQQVRFAVLELCPAPADCLPSAQSLGNKLRHLRGRMIGGRCLDYREGRGHKRAWYVVPAPSKR